MDQLPSYTQATTAPHWLQLVAPYIPRSQWRRCALVNSRFYEQFAPRLWIDPLVTARAYGLHPNDDLAWYRRFVNIHLRSVRLSTRALVRSLDFKDFAVVASGLYSTDADDGAIWDSFRALPDLFPQLLCLLLDGHPELNPESLVWTQDISQEHGYRRLQLLDLAHCHCSLATRMFKSPFLRDLVYLDVSSLSGSVANMVQISLNPEYLPELRILKARNREMDDATAYLLLQKFALQLWSLDLSDNKLTDATIESLLHHHFSSQSVRTDAHFEVEGKLSNPQRLGTMSFGPFELIEESDKSSTFSHPMRYLPDVPPYVQRGQHELQEWQTIRNTGLESLQPDSAESVRECLLDDSLTSISVARTRDSDFRTLKGGLTHLYLNGNHFSAAGIQRLLRCTWGRLEHFECTGATYSRPEDASRLQIRGLCGLSHLLRPVFASNLRSLRLHHSVVTQVLDVYANDISHHEAAIYAETVLRERIRMAYPRAFAPDMNPRLTSLTLTGIPARSHGPLISALVGFLEQATDQQRAIARVAVLNNGRGSALLNGLQHIRLELLPEKSEELSGVLDGMYLSLKEAQDSVTGTETVLEVTNHTVSKSQAESSTSSSLSGPKPLPGGGLEQQFMINKIEAAESLSGNVFTVPVWTGTTTQGVTWAVEEYMRNMQDPNLRKDVGPAMPDHVAAGVPSGSYLFYRAWNAMILPPQLPRINENATDEDVADAIKQYRMMTRGTDRHWKGKLELVRTSSDMHNDFTSWR